MSGQKQMQMQNGTPTANPIGVCPHENRYKLLRQWAVAESASKVELKK